MSGHDVISKHVQSTANTTERERDRRDDLDMGAWEGGGVARREARLLRFKANSYMCMRVCVFVCM